MPLCARCCCLALWRPAPVTAANSAIGWYLADSKLTPAPPFIPPAVNDSLSILPTASSVTVTFALALSTTYSSTLLTQRVPITQLLANIVGLSGLLTIFGIAFGSFEGYCSRRAGKKRTPLRSSNGGTEGGSAEAAPQLEAAEFAVDNLLRQSPPTQRAANAVAVMREQGGGAQRGALMPRAVSANCPAAQAVWRRQNDASGDVWFINSAGETAWELPPGARLEPAPALELPASAVTAGLEHSAGQFAGSSPAPTRWIRAFDGVDTWFLSEADHSAAWSLPPGGIVVGEKRE